MNIRFRELIVERGSGMLPQVISQNDTTLRRFMRRLLWFCLEWFRDEELGEYDDAIIIIRKKCDPQITYGVNSICYQPSQEEDIRYINTTEWNILNKPQKVTLEKLEKLFTRYLSECTTRRINQDGYTLLEISWPDNIEIQPHNSQDFIKGRKSMSAAYCILTIISKKPDWIGAQLSSSTCAFGKSILLGFEQKGFVIYEGSGATYVLKNGLKYIGAKKRGELKGNKDRIKVIEHRRGYENWEKEIEEILK